MQAYLAKRRAEEKPVIVEKECSKCKEVKPASDFYKRLHNADGLNSQCRKCIQQLNAEYARTIEPHRISAWRHGSHLKARYGMSLDEYEYLASAQDNKSNTYCLLQKADICNYPVNT